MTPASSFAQVLAHRGRVLLFTTTAEIAQQFEHTAERQHARVICTRGCHDPFFPIAVWHTIHTGREYAVFSTDQHRYVNTYDLPCTDLVWVGRTGDPVRDPMLWHRFSVAMSRDINSDNPPRLWLLPEDGA